MRKQKKEGGTIRGPSLNMCQKCQSVAKNAGVVCRYDKQVKVQNSPIQSWQNSSQNTAQSIGSSFQVKYWPEETNKNKHKSKNHNYFEKKY